MFVLIQNFGDGDNLWSTMHGVFDTHKEAHDMMVQRIESHKAEWVEAYGGPEDAYTVEIGKDEGSLVDGDWYDWSYYEKFLIFDSKKPRRFNY